MSSDGATVEFKADGNDVEASRAEIKSPAKNRLKGTALTPSEHDGSDEGSRRIPRLFERSSRSWWNPKFDTSVLEDQHSRSSFPQTKKRFQYALGYITILCVIWAIYFGLSQLTHWIAFLSGVCALLVITVSILAFTFTAAYQRFMLHTSIALSVLLCVSGLLSFVYDDPDMSAVGTFAGSIEILLMMYTVIPLPLYLSILIGVLYSVGYEVMSALMTDMNEPSWIVARALLHFCIHLIGVHIFIMNQVRKRSTFLKVGQSIMARCDLQVEKGLKQKMIYSLMPQQVADDVMQTTSKDKKDDADDVGGPRSGARGSSTPDDACKLTFRSFHMSQLDNVSILFADIVGFTKMSSNKTAEHLVSLLNDLFGRFDIICKKCGCEKISTLGDCYYCVSGCPEPRADHAKCCVEMGIDMCRAIKEFDEDHNEEVNMRVGVHTGTVLCGLVGTRRFKFDVWSHDVTLANTMESDGKPGTVHVSDSTYKFIKDDYEVEEGEEVKDIRKHKVLIEHYNKVTQQYAIRHVQDEDTILTWFIVGRKGPDGKRYPLQPDDDEKKSTEALAADGVKVTLNGSAKDDENDAPTAQLLDKQNDVTASSENVANADGKKHTALMDQLKGAKRVSGIGIEESDKLLVSAMQADSALADYLYHPPINQGTLNFLSAKLEREYRNHYIDDSQDVIATLALPRFSALADVIVSFIFFITISACCFMGFGISIQWVIVFVFALIIELLMLIPVVCDVCITKTFSPTLARAGRFFSRWFPRHIFGSVIASLPAIAVYANFSCTMFDETPYSDLFYCLVLVASLLHYCNFTMLSSWMKSSIATLAGLVLLILIAIGVCAMNFFLEPDYYTDSQANLSTTALPALVGTTDMENLNLTSLQQKIFSGEHPIKYEIILNVALLLFLIWFLNREFEISYRLCFHGDKQAQTDRQKIAAEKDQADWLLHNIIPKHVAEVLKQTSQYCRNHKDVGVIFAKVVNFDDFYDESFEGGKEYLRVLNEMMGDFEDLFDDPKYKDVEKIKTIGSCLMAASGLNPSRSENKDPMSHLYALVDFCVDLLGKLEQFNAEIFNFDFEMAIGFNTGEVTSGVIGTTKLLYDIWGDTVNVSSRMYSTGVSGKIQVTENTAKLLGDKFDFEYKGKTYVKGKGDMNTYLLAGKKPGATWE